MNTKQLRPRLNPEEIEELNAVAKSLDYQATQLAGILIREGLRAIKAVPYPLPMPLRFKIEKGEGEISFPEEPRSRYRAGKIK